MNEKIPELNKLESFNLSNSVQIAHLEEGPVLIDGDSELSVSLEVARRLQKLLTLQEKIDIHWKNLQGGYDHEEREFAQVNCRRAVMYLEGDLSYEEMVSETVNEDDPNVDREIILQKVNTYLENNPEHMVDSFQDLQDLLSNLDTPAEIHITDIFSGASLPDHSLYCLGKDTKGNFMVAEKTGPLVGNDFYYRSLEESLADYRASDTLYGYIVIPSEEKEVE